MNDHREMKEIKSIINQYIEGTYEGDAGKLKAVFDERAVMNGFLGKETILATPEVFIEDMAGSASMKETGDPYDAETEYIKIDGDIAAACLTETGFKGNGVMINHFHFIKRDGKWRIISKLFTTKND